MQIISEQVTEALRQRILEQAYGPGDRLNTYRIARELGVSHTPVREALGRLQGEGLVTYRRSHGYHVTPLSVREVQEMLDCRLVLEVFAAQQIAPITAEFVQRLETIHERFSAAIARRQYFDNNAADREFHDTIVAAAGNSLLLRLFRSMDSHMHTMRLFYFSARTRKQDLRETLAEHERVLAAFQRRSRARAVEALTGHLRNVKRRAQTLAPLFAAREQDLTGARAATRHHRSGDR